MTDNPTSPPSNAEKSPTAATAPQASPTTTAPSTPNTLSAATASRHVTGGTETAYSRGELSWVLFEWARNPYVILVTIYIFAPYFTNVVVGDPVEGQSIWGYTNGIAGFFIAVFAPLFGAIADKGGSRKPWIATFVAIMAPCMFLLWWALPGADGGLSIWTIAALIVVIGIAFEYSSVFHNSMLPHITTPAKLGGLSGLGLAAGNASSLLILVFMLFCFALPGQMDWSFLPEAPLFGLDQESYQHSRISGPIVALWLVVFSIPLFLYTPDAKPSPQPLPTLVVQGLETLYGTLRKLPQFRNIATYLLARMFYNDGKTAILIFGGVYAVGVFGWDEVRMLIYGIFLSVFAVVGGFFGGWLDNTVGSKRAIMISIGITTLGVIATVSTTPTQILFVIPYDPETAPPVWSFPYFNTWPEIVFMSLMTMVAVAITAAYANSRTMMARLAPPTMTTEFFGLYALSGTATAFLAPMTVGFFTDLFQSQRAGYASILLLLGAGLALMLFVKEEQARSLP